MHKRWYTVKGKIIDNFLITDDNKYYILDCLYLNFDNCFAIIEELGCNRARIVKIKNFYSNQVLS